MNRAVDELPSDPLALRLAALFLVVRGLGPYRPDVYDLPVAVVGIALLFSQRLRLHPSPWLGLFVYMMALNVGYFHLSANHFYVLAYWTLGCGLALATRNPPAVMAHNARILLGLAFALATVWKLATGEYLDGSYFHFSLLTRFIDSDSAPLVSRMLSLENWAENLRLREQLMLAPAESDWVTLSSNGGARILAQFLSAWTLLIEGLIGFMFLAGRWRPAVLSRDSLLLVFCATTFLIIPIDRFGMILAILGLAQCPPHRKRQRLAYVVLFLAIPFLSPLANRVGTLFF